MDDKQVSVELDNSVKRVEDVRDEELKRLQTLGLGCAAFTYMTAWQGGEPGMVPEDLKKHIDELERVAMRRSISIRRWKFWG